MQIKEHLQQQEKMRYLPEVFWYFSAIYYKSSRFFLVFELKELIQ